MGIKQLFSIIKDEAPDAIKEGEIKNQFGRKVAIVCHCEGLHLRTPR
jgi:flap endonuclease-1